MSGTRKTGVEAVAALIGTPYEGPGGADCAAIAGKVLEALRLPPFPEDPEAALRGKNAWGRRLARGERFMAGDVLVMKGMVVERGAIECPAAQEPAAASERWHLAVVVGAAGPNPVNVPPVICVHTTRGSGCVATRIGELLANHRVWFAVRSWKGGR